VPAWLDDECDSDVAVRSHSGETNDPPPAEFAEWLWVEEHDRRLKRYDDLLLLLAADRERILS
jgi:hypothetical protein